MKETLLVIPNVSHIVKFLKHEYNLISDYEVMNGEVNFDKVLKFDDGGNEIEKICELKNIPIIGCERYGKHMQFEILKKLGILTPNTYYITDNNLDYNNFYTMCKDIPNDSPIIIKDRFGARSIGLMKLSSKDIFYKLCYSFFPSGDKEEDVLFEEKIPQVHSYYDDIVDDISFYGRVQNELERRYISTFIENGFVVQEIEEIKAEYRMMWFNGEFILNRRDKESLSNKSYIDYELSDSQEIEMVEISERLANYLNTPFLSIDFYITEKINEDEIGVIEFQMQMGYTNVDKTEIVEKTINSVVSKFKDLK